MNLAENISNAFKVVEKTHAAVNKLLDRLKAEYDDEQYKLLSQKFLRWHSDNNCSGWCYQTFQLAYQRVQNGDAFKNGFLNGPIYIIEINFWQFDTPKIVVAKMDYGDLSTWNEAYVGPSNYWRFAEPLHYYKDMFMREDLHDEIYKIVPRPHYKDKAANDYKFASAYVTTLELVDINGDNYKDEIFGAVEKLHDFVE